MENKIVSVSKGATTLDASGEEVVNYEFNQFEKYKTAKIPTNKEDILFIHLLLYF